MAENKGKPSGREASKKTDPGRKRDSRARSGQSGAFGRGMQQPEEKPHPAGQGDFDQQAGGADHHGGDAHEDRNP
jgi:hypothetical protein